MGLAGIFKNCAFLKKSDSLKLAFGCALVGIFRYTAHVISGIFAFEAYAKGQNPVLFSLAYNLYVLVDIALVIGVAYLLLSSKSINQEFVKIR